MIRLRKDGTAWSCVGDESVVLDLQASQYLTLNETATFLWALVSEGTDEPAMVAALQAEYDVDRVTASAAVEDFVEGLRRRGYLREDA